MISQIMCVSSSFLNTSSIPWEKYGSPYLDKSQKSSTASLTGVCGALCVHKMVRLPVLGIFNVQTNVDACD